MLSKMASGCVIHFQNIDVNQHITTCSDLSLSKIVECASEWCTLVGEAEAVSVSFRKLLDSNVIQPGSTSYGYHRDCYQRFTSKLQIRRARKRQAQNSGSGSVLIPSEEMPKRRTRGATVSSVVQQSEGHLLPSICIICQREKYRKNIRGTYVKESRSKCESNNAGQKLLQAAQRKEDEIVLLQIRNCTDFVAAELQYHRSCFRAYLKNNSGSSTSSTGTGGEKENLLSQPETNYANSTIAFEQFCTDIVAGKLLNDQCVLGMKKLHKMYLQYTRDNNTSSVFVKCQSLKIALKSRFPGLQFFQVFQRNKSELVYFHTSALAKYMDASHSEDEDDDEEEEMEEEIETDNDMDSGCFRSGSTCSTVKELFMAGLHLKSILTQHPHTLKAWPHQPGHLKADRSDVPFHLFNVVAVMTGLSDQPGVDDYVQIDDGVLEKKLIAICQDIIFLASRGKKPTAKHVALAMTVRHWTGSAKLVEVLNGFGHCVSNTYALEMDTAIAVDQMKQDRVTPPTMDIGRFTTVVFDNTDFNEETLTGKGTTHCTSGIVIQRSNDHLDEPVPPCQPAQSESKRKKKQRVTSIPTPDSDLPLFVQRKRQGPEPVAVDSSIGIWNDVILVPQALDLLYSLSKMPEVTTHSLPSWTGFNIGLKQGSIPPISKIGYLPLIQSSPTEMSTVLAILQRSLRIADELELEKIVLVFDQAIYAKAQIIRWQTPVFNDRLIVRLGEFHTSMAFMAVLAKRFDNTGLRDLLVECDIIAEGSVAAALSGGFYNRGIRCYKLLFDCLCRLQWREYLDSLSAEDREEKLQFARRLCESYPNDFEEGAKSEEAEEIIVTFKAHKLRRAQESPNYALWDSLQEMLQILLLFVRGTREGNFKLHLASVRAMLPWFFAFDRQNYARFLTVYFFEMMQLKDTHPEVYCLFGAGEFVVQRSADNPFSQAACDLVIEQTVNKESKAGGGMVGITTKKGAVHRWLLTRLARSAIASVCSEMAGRQQKDHLHKDLRISRIETDERDVRRLTTTITDEMTNPFSPTVTHPHLLNISSGVVADPAVMEDMLSAKVKGDAACETFIRERLSSREKDFFAPITRMKLKTFQQAKKADRKQQKINSVTATRTMTTRVLIASRVRNISLQSVLKYNLSDIPKAIANDDGTMTKTDKSKLATELIKYSAVVENLHADATIIDAMALLHQQVYIPKTFGELAKKLLTQIISMGRSFGSCRVDFVADRYPDLSIKQLEHHRRYKEKARSIYITRSCQEVPTSFSQYLSLSSNKEDLLRFLALEWQHLSGEIPEDMEIFLAYGLVCQKFTHGETVGVQELQSDHEESDSRMLLHAQHASASCGSVVVKTPDTDVLVLCVGFALEISADLFVCFGIGRNTKMVNATSIALNERLGVPACNGLIGLHCFTGSDSTSCFRFKGKTKALELMLSNHKAQNTFAQLGVSWNVHVHLLADLEEFVCALYGEKECTDVDEVRYRLFCRDLRSEENIPPTKDSLILHSQRANYQAAIHRRSLMQYISPPSPLEHGWEQKNGHLQMTWMKQPPIPDDILNMVTCKCAKSACDTLRCKCQAAGLQCTELCKCKNCANNNDHAQDVHPTAVDLADSSDSDSELES